MLCRTASASFSGCVVVAVRMPVSVLAAQPGLVGATGCTAPRAGRHRQGAVPARASAGAEPARAQNGPGTDPVLLVQFDRPCARLRFWHIRCEHRVLLRGPRPQRRGGGAAEGQVMALGPACCVRATLGSRTRRRAYAAQLAARSRKLAAALLLRAPRDDRG